MTTACRQYHTVKMPVKSHENYRAEICLFCLKKVNIKARSYKKIVGKVLAKVTSIKGYENYNGSDERFPIVCCSTCFNITNRKSPDIVHEYLPKKFDFTQLPTPRFTRSTSTCSKDCIICETGRNHLFNSGQNKQHKTKIKIGSPKKQGPSRIPNRVPIKVCQRCYQILGTGIAHPFHCGMTEFRKNVLCLLEGDPYGYELAASKLIKSKAANVPQSPTIDLSTPGVKMTISKPITKKSYVSRGLFTTSPVQNQEWSKMKSAAKLTGHQSLIVASFYRMWNGRNSIQSHLNKTVQLNSHCLQGYYSTKSCLLDSSDKKEREMGQLVKRPVVFNNDLEATFENVCNVRGYSSKKDTYLKIGADSGQGFLKVCGTIQSLDDIYKNDIKSDSQENEKSEKWSYKDGIMAGKYKDGGVKRLLILGKNIPIFIFHV